MNENKKPLSEDGRAECEFFARDEYSLHAQQIRNALAAEAYWRERCAKLDPYGRGVVEESTEF